MFDTFAKRNDGSLHMFELDSCEACGKDVVGANAVTLCESLEVAEKVLGLKRRDDVVEELAYCETLGQAVCCDCHVE